MMDVTSESFEREVLERSHELPVVVDFWAAWCGPCRMLGPVLEREASRAPGEFALAKVDVDANPELALRYEIQGIPAVKAFRNGEVVAEFVGAQPPAAVAQFLDELTGPTATERLIAELNGSGELPEVRQALEHGEPRARLRAAARGHRRRRGRRARAADHPDRRPLRRARPRAPADDALPAAARRQPLLMAITTETEPTVRAEGVPLPGQGRVARGAARRRPGGGQAGDRDHRTARVPGQRPHDLEPRGLLRRRRGLVSGRHLHRPRRPRRPRLHQPDIEGDGVAGKRADGRFGFTRLSLRLAVETDPADEPQARRLAEQAEQTCLVSASLDLPIETVIEANQPSVP